MYVCVYVLADYEYMYVAIVFISVFLSLIRRCFSNDSNFEWFICIPILGCLNFSNLHNSCLIVLTLYSCSIKHWWMFERKGRRKQLMNNNLMFTKYETYRFSQQGDKNFCFDWIHHLLQDFHMRMAQLPCYVFLREPLYCFLII